MIFRRFALLLILRLSAIGVAMAAIVWLYQKPGFHSGMILTIAVFFMLIAELWRFVNKTNLEVSRFLDAARYADFSQRFDFANQGAGFQVLGEVFSDILSRMQSRSSEREIQARRLTALIEHIPVPLLTLHVDDTITLHNNAARRLFGAEHVTRLRDLRKFGAGFSESVANAVPGHRELVTFSVEGIEYHLTLATTEIVVAGNSDRLVSLQDIQSELDATQAQAWEELVRVLTHEIMNSITPVTSLAKTALDVVDDVVQKNAEGQALGGDLGDLRDAVATVARRSDSLTHFVDSYRQISRLAPPEKKRINLQNLFESVSQLALAEWAEQPAALHCQVHPAELCVHADRDLLEPVLLNLLRNAWQATLGVDSASIELNARLNRRSNVVIEVVDNGPGVSEDIAKKIFVPFYTTKEDGSGVGLALARQVMIAHGGFIRVSNSPTGGATFTMTF